MSDRKTREQFSASELSLWHFQIRTILMMFFIAGTLDRNAADCGGSQFLERPNRAGILAFASSFVWAKIWLRPSGSGFRKRKRGFS
jgi:hypothetical protein